MAFNNQLNLGVNPLPTIQGGTGAALTSTPGAMIVTDNSGTSAYTSTMTDGQIVIGATGGSPRPATLTAGSGITISNFASAITISSAGGLDWSTISGTSQLASIDNVYIVGNSAQTTITLPATAPLGSVIRIYGFGAGGWILQANTGQTIRYGASVSSSGGTFVSANQYDVIEVAIIVADTIWSVGFAVTSGFTIA